MFGLKHIRDWYGRFERPISSISLVVGFILGAIFLKQVDFFWENFWIFVHLVLIALSIILINYIEHHERDEDNPEKLHFWLLNLLQLLFGGVLSTFLVFYFRSATLSTSWPFLLILFFAILANERLKRHYSRLNFQIGFFYLSLFSFFIFFIPILVHRVGAWVFALSGVMSLVVIISFLYLLVKITKEKSLKHPRRLVITVGSIFLIINVLYFTNIIPPLPLSLKDSGIYHSVTRDPAGFYVVEGEEQGWLGYFELYPDFHLVYGEVVYAFSSVFSPASFYTGVVHEWQHQDRGTGDWTTEGRVSLAVSGGRDGGYRTYSTRAELEEGYWRVNVLTSSGLVLGRLRFNVVQTNVEPILITEVSN